MMLPDQQFMIRFFKSNPCAQAFDFRKARLEKYIGKLSFSDMKGLNHALAISIGLMPVGTQKLTLCLCSTCAENFYDSGAYSIRRVNPIEVEKEVCTYCNQRAGYDYEIAPRTKIRK